MESSELRIAAEDQSKGMDVLELTTALDAGNYSDTNLVRVLEEYASADGAAHRVIGVIHRTDTDGKSQTLLCIRKEHPLPSTLEEENQVTPARDVDLTPPIQPGALVRESAGSVE